MHERRRKDCFAGISQNVCHGVYNLVQVANCCSEFTGLKGLPNPFTAEPATLVGILSTSKAANNMLQ